jgi:hypothetical protein
VEWGWLCHLLVVTKFYLTMLCNICKVGRASDRNFAHQDCANGYGRPSMLEQGIGECPSEQPNALQQQVAPAGVELDANKMSINSADKGIYGDNDSNIPAPIYRQGYADANGTKWSIEVLPCDGESREDCQKRISQSFEGLLKAVEEGPAIK